MRTVQDTAALQTTALEARYEPRRLVPGLAVSAGLAAVGVVSATVGVTIGWLLAIFMLWSVANTLTKMRRREPVLTLDGSGATDHRVPLHVAWDDVASMRTVNRRALLFAKIPLLELVPNTPGRRDAKTMIGAVLRGDIAFGDARNHERVMMDLRYLDATPEEVMAAARALRRA